MHGLCSLSLSLSLSFCCLLTFVSYTQFILVHYCHATFRGKQHSGSRVAAGAVDELLGMAEEFHGGSVKGVGVPEIVVRNGQPFAQNIS